MHKYIALSPLEKWIRGEDEPRANISSIWRDVLCLIRNGLAWKVGNGEKVQIDIDPWSRSGEGHILPQPLFVLSRDIGISLLVHIVIQENTTIWRQCWKSTMEVRIEENFFEAWNCYLVTMANRYIKINDKEYEPVWSCSPTRFYTQKPSYIVINTGRSPTYPKWLWRAICKSKCSGKDRIFMWCLMEKKVPTCEILQRHFTKGSGWNSLYKGDEESNEQLFKQ